MDITNAIQHFMQTPKSIHSSQHLKEISPKLTTYLVTKQISTDTRNLKNSCAYHQMDHFLDRYHIPKLNQDQINNFKRPIAGRWWCTPVIPALGRQRQVDF